MRIREILDRNVSGDLQEDTEDNGRQNRQSVVVLGHGYAHGTRTIKEKEYLVFRAEGRTSRLLP